MIYVYKCDVDLMPGCVMIIGVMLYSVTCCYSNSLYQCLCIKLVVVHV